MRYGTLKQLDGIPYNNKLREVFNNEPVYGRITATIDAISEETLKEIIFGEDVNPERYYMEFKVQQKRTDKLHKKKRISKKWAKQGRYRLVNKTISGDFELDKSDDGDLTYYTARMI